MSNLKTSFLIGLLSLFSSSGVFAAITITFSQGLQPDEIEYQFSGSDFWSGGTTSSQTGSESHLPFPSASSARWRYTDSSPWDQVAPFSNDIGIVALEADSTFEILVDGEVIDNIGASLSGDDLAIDGDAGGDFTLKQLAPNRYWQFPSVEDGQEIAYSGRGAFVVSGGLAANMTPGVHSHTASGGITFQAVVVSTVPEPTSASLIILGVVGGILRRRR